MGKKTNIGWCDSSVNIMMGCGGCELWTKKKRTCYAGVMTDRYGGRKGWPESFDKPKIFPERLQQALRWPDLTGQDHPDKPWLNGYPRLIFLDDMGDTFTESLPIDWLLPHIPLMEQSPHIWQFLTKRPKRMATFFNEILGYVPDNFWLGTSITSQATAVRANYLSEIEAKIKFLSIEPILEPIDLEDHAYEHPGPDWAGFNPLFDQIIIGGESGHNQCQITELEWISGIVSQFDGMDDVAIFVKQLGSRPYFQGRPYPISDGKGEILSEYPEYLQRREMPHVETNETLFEI